MGGFRKTLNVVVLGAVMAFSLVLGAVFPVPPLMLLSRRRRTDPIELVLPAVTGTGLDLTGEQIPTSFLDRTVLS